MSIRNYNAFLKAVKKKHGTTHKQAQSAYRRLSKKIGRPAKGVDVSKHPRLTRAALQGRKRGTVSRGGRVTRASEKPSRLRRITSIADWTAAIRSGQFGPVETQLVVSSADYGRGKKGRR